MAKNDLQGDLDLLVLKTLSQSGELHGYGIALHIERPIFGVSPKIPCPHSFKSRLHRDSWPNWSGTVSPFPSNR